MTDIYFKEWRNFRKKLPLYENDLNGKNMYPCCCEIFQALKKKAFTTILQVS